MEGGGKRVVCVEGREGVKMPHAQIRLVGGRQGKVDSSPVTKNLEGCVKEFELYLIILSCGVIEGGSVI